MYKRQPVRRLTSELKSTGRLRDSIDGTVVHARLSSVRDVGAAVKAFTFRLSRPVNVPLPGGHGVFDFSHLLDEGYSHMDEARPQSVNEDYLRTWTLSSAPEFDPETGHPLPTDTLEITVKRQSNGLVSNFLHRHAAQLMAEDAVGPHLRGVGGGFSCFSAGSTSVVRPKMLWVAGGIGITPFISMWRALDQMAHTYSDTDVVMVFSGRDDDLDLIRSFLQRIDDETPSPQLRLLVYRTSPKEPVLGRLDPAQHIQHPKVEMRTGRLHPADLCSIDDVLDREAYLCGPPALVRSVEHWLLAQGGDASRIHHESYNY